LRILMMQDPKTRRGIEEATVQRRWPKTWAYLKHFEKPLRERSGFKRYFTRQDKRGAAVETGPFYSLFNVGGYTFAPWKVVWRGEVAASLVAAVVSTSSNKVVVPDQTAYMTAFNAQEDAHFLCGIMNSAPVRLVYAMQAYKHVSMSFVQNLNVPHFDPTNLIHCHLVALSQRAHELAPAACGGDATAQDELRQVEAQVDVAAASLWDLNDDELAEIKRSLAELR
jgi:hypothetical protein